MARGVWMVLLVSACGDSIRPLPSPDSAPEPVELVTSMGGIAIFQDPDGTTVQHGEVGARASAELPRGGTVVLLWGQRCDTENYCSFSAWVVRDVKAGDRITLTNNSAQVVPGSPYARTTTCTFMWLDPQPPACSPAPGGCWHMTATYQLLVGDSSATPVIPRLPDAYGRLDVTRISTETVFCPFTNHARAAEPL